MADDDEFRRWWDRAGNRGASPATARALLEVYFRSDVRDVLGVINVPTPRGAPLRRQGDSRGERALPG